MFKDDISWALLVLILLLLLLVFFRSPYFTVWEIHIDQTTFFSPEEILDSVELPLGENIFMVHRAQLSRLILENPRVKRVEIMRRLPQTLCITIQEHRPLAYIYQDQMLFLLNREGVFMRREEVPGHFPLPYLYLQDSAVVGEKVGTAALEYISLLSYFSSAFLARLNEVQIFTDKLVLSFSKGGQVFLDLNISYEKASQLEVLYQELQDKKMLDYIDMRYKGNPVIKYEK